MQHMDIIERIATNIARKTGHSVDDLRQIASIGLLQASRRYIPEKGNFRSYARKYANGEVFHYLRSHGFTIKVPASWRELHIKGKRLIEKGADPGEVHSRLGLTKDKWDEIQMACTQRVISLELVVDL